MDKLGLLLRVFALAAIIFFVGGFVIENIAEFIMCRAKGCNVDVFFVPCGFAAVTLYIVFALWRDSRN
jgi:hypothetical protein|tara:strand:+ start:28165 stop:28368 length:204 start_codon:yes stop_codon:yes gene_type:complete